MMNMESTATTTTTTITTATAATETTIIQNKTMSKLTAGGDKTEEALGAGATGERKPTSPGATATTTSSLLPDPNWKPTATPPAAPPANAAPRRAFGATKGPRRLSDLKEVDENATESSEAASSSAALTAVLSSVDSDSILTQRRPSAPGFGKFTGLGLPFQNTSIWKEQSSINRLRPSAAGVDGGVSFGVSNGSEEPPFRNYRSSSYSVGQGDTFADVAAKFGVSSTVTDEELDPAYLASLDEELTEEEYARIIMDRMRQSRSRSTFNGLGGQSLQSSNPLLAGRRSSYQHDTDLNALRASLAARGLPMGLNNNNSAAHRRSFSAATQPPPGYGSVYFDRPGQPVGGAAQPSLLSTPDRLERLAQIRRLSLAPVSSFGADGLRQPFGPPSCMQRSGSQRLGVPSSGMSGSGLSPDFALLGQRRHSLATATLSYGGSNGGSAGSAHHRMLADALDSLQLGESRTSSAYASLPVEELDEFSQDSAMPRRRSIADIGKGVPLAAIPNQTPLYIVEFKAGRSDLYYVSDAMNGMVKKGDLVIVEADRGKDLGKVTNDRITPVQVQQLQRQQAEQMPDLHRGNKEIHPKRIYRLAQPGEVSMLVQKSQDEAKALAVCQQKVLQRKLPMEVVDAEYQWDRRKLTFYFVADRRIDFRELVRDLFKNYKTRIWMCAVNPAAANQSGVNDNAELAAELTGTSSTFESSPSNSAVDTPSEEKNTTTEEVNSSEEQVTATVEKTATTVSPTSAQE